MFFQLPKLFIQAVSFIIQHPTLTDKYKDRIKICRTCKDNIGKSWFPICGICGCCMKLKARFKDAECDEWKEL